MCVILGIKKMGFFQSCNFLVNRFKGSCGSDAVEPVGMYLEVVGVTGLGGRLYATLCGNLGTPMRHSGWQEVSQHIASAHQCRTSLFGRFFRLHARFQIQEGVPVASRWVQLGSFACITCSSDLQSYLNALVR